MRQLVWKEYRESVWLLLGTLAATLVLLVLVRAMHLYEGPWPNTETGVTPAFLIFAVWGGSRMAHEREGGRLTLRTLPISDWQIWLVKVPTGIVWAVVCALVLNSLGQPSEPWIISSVVAGMSMCYLLSFLASLFMGAQSSSMLGSACAVAWLIFCNAARSGRFGWTNPGATLASTTWWMVLLLAAVITGVMVLRRFGAEPRYARVGAIATTLAAVGILFVSPFFGAKRPVDVAEFYSHAWHGVLTSQSAGRVAYAEAGARGTQLWVRDLDGANPRLMTDRARLTPLCWAPGGKLVYASRKPGQGTIDLMLWDPGKGSPRVVAVVLAAERKAAAEYANLDGTVAAEPNGHRLAYLAQWPGMGSQEDLWVVDLLTGRRRVICSVANETRVTWREGRIYLRTRYSLQAISPEGGRLQAAGSLPAVRGEESTWVER